MRKLALAAALLSLAACATPSGTQQPRKYPTDPISGFAWCMSFGCSDMQVGDRVSPAQWAEIGAFFAGTRDAAENALSRCQTRQSPGSTQISSCGRMLATAACQPSASVASP